MSHVRNLPISPVPGRDLYVVTVVTNYRRFRRRYELYRDFAEHMEQAGAILYTVEIALGERAFEVTETGNPRHIQLRTRHELFVKECGINIGNQFLPPEAKYIAWIDADVSFIRRDFVYETLHMLQHYDVVQMWSTGEDLNFDDEPFQHYRSFCSTWLSEGLSISGKQTNAVAGTKLDWRNPYYGGAADWHTGFAWAAKRSALDKLGGLLDICITGAGDWLMAWGLVGQMRKNTHQDWAPGFMMQALEWEKRATKYIRGNIGCVPGAILHHWHGNKKSRQYGLRELNLTRNLFNPLTDLKRDTQGLWQLCDDGSDRYVKMRDGLRAYFKVRNEDSIDS